MNKHKGKRRVQKRPNYKNVGEEEDEEKQQQPGVSGPGMLITQWIWPRFGGMQRGAQIGRAHV